MHSRNTRRPHRLIVLPTIMAFAACADPAAVEGPTWLVASILEADSTVQYSGTGNFGKTGDFSMWSRGTGTSDGETVIFTRDGESRPGPGSYDFVQQGSPEAGFIGFYRRLRDDGVRDRFAVISGLLVITISSEERIDGTFRFTGELFCSTPAGAAQDSSCDPGIPISGANPVVIEGSFSVAPYGAFCPASLGNQSCF